MAGLLDFLFQGQGGGLLGGMGQQQPMNIQPPGMGMGMGQSQLQGPSGNPYPGGMDPAIYAMRALQGPQSNGFLGGFRSALDQIGDPEGKRSQEAVRNYISLKQLGIQEKAAEEKPQVIQVDDPDTGLKRAVLIQPFGKGAQWLDIKQPGGGSAPSQSPLNLPAGADVKTAREATARDAVANQQDAVKSAKAAADIQPLLDEMHNAYEAAHKAGATGPIAASTVGRYGATGLAALGDATGLGSTSKPLEAARQRYDIAKAAVQARITAAQNKGEGQVSNYERQLYAAQFPDLSALDPETQIKNLAQVRNQNKQTIEAGKIPSLGQAPQVEAVLNRPAVNPGAAPAQAPQAQPTATPIKVSTQAQYNMLSPGQTYTAPDGSIRTKGGGAAPRPSPSTNAIY